MLTVLRRRRVEATREATRRPSTTWPGQAARLSETDAELRHRLGIAPLATPAIAPVVAVPATSNELEALIGVPEPSASASEVLKSVGKVMLLYILFDRLYQKFLNFGFIAECLLWSLAHDAARAEPVRKVLLELLFYAFGTYLFAPRSIGACLLWYFADRAAVAIERKFPRHATLVEDFVPTSAVAVAI